MLKKEYFKGFYFKCSSETQTAAFIPSIHHYNGKAEAFLQIITDRSAYQLPVPQIKIREKPLFIKIKGGVLCERGIRLNIRTKELAVNGVLNFGRSTPLRYDIMGCFKYVPFLQCRHSVISMAHRVSGEITINGERLKFSNDHGYIEGDSGTSFPERYVWTQCDFPNGSLMLSAADIPLFGCRFTGIICAVILNGKEHRLATYLGAKLKHIGKDAVTVSQGGYKLTARLIEKNAHPLSAPVRGQMNRTIRESASCTAYYRFSYKNDVLCEFTSDRASFEFEY